MKHNSCILILYIACIAIFTGCATGTINPLSGHYENNFTNFQASEQELIKSSSIKKTFHKSFDDVWDDALYILAQHAIIIDASRESGIITFVSIDGLYFGDLFSEKSYLLWEFPFTVFIDAGNQGVTVFVYAMKNIYEEKYKEKNWWKIVDAGFDQEGEEFLQRLSTQLTVQEQWQWLRN